MAVRTRNGVHHGPIPAPPVTAGPAPRLEVWVPLAEEYPDWQFLFWRNHPRRVRVALTTAVGHEATAAAFKELVRAHNGWSDHEGRAYPQPDTDAFWDEIPTEVALTLYQRVQEESWTLPNSLMKKPATSDSISSSSEAAETPPETLFPGPTSAVN